MVKKPEPTKPLLRVRQVRSPIGFPRNQHEVLRSLGLRRINHVVERVDTPATRGMIRKISHLVTLDEGMS